MIFLQADVIKYSWLVRLTCKTDLASVTPCMFHFVRGVPDGKREVTTEDNPAYGLSGPHGRHGETKDEYEYIQSSSATAPQVTVYEGVL